MRYNNISIKGVGSFLPEKIITNKDLEKLSDTTDEWISKSLGIEERRVVEGRLGSDLGVIAALKAIENAHINKEDIDLIVVATSSPEKISPSTACTIHKKLGIEKDIPSFDINAVCAGFIFGFEVASSLINSGIYKNILLVGTETYSRITDYTHRNCVFFGDGAGAVVLAPSEKGWVFTELKSNGGGTGSTGFECSVDRPYTTMPGQVKDQALKVLPDSIRSVLHKADISPSEVALFIPHQASINILRQIAFEVGISVEKIKCVMHKYGNIAGASIPIALDDAIKNGEIKAGDKILLTAIGSGWSWGSILVNYE